MDTCFTPIYKNKSNIIHIQINHYNNMNTFCGLVLSDLAKEIVDIDNRLAFAIKLKDVYFDMLLTKFRQLDVIDAAINRAKEACDEISDDNMKEKINDIVGNSNDDNSNTLWGVHESILKEIDGDGSSTGVDNTDDMNYYLENKIDPYTLDRTHWLKVGLKNAIQEIRDAIKAFSDRLNQIAAELSGVGTAGAADNTKSGQAAINALIKKLNSKLAIANQALFDINNVPFKDYIEDEESIVDMNDHECEAEDEKKLM